jgi:hypothetical protein
MFHLTSSAKCKNTHILDRYTCIFSHDKFIITVFSKDSPTFGTAGQFYSFLLPLLFNKLNITILNNKVINN